MEKQNVQTQEKDLRPILDKRTQVKIDIGLVLGYISSIIFLIVAYHNDFHKETIITFLILFTGLTIGGLIGTLSTPFSEDEKTKFTALKTAIIGFISGYLLSKLDPVFDIVVNKSGLINMDSFIRLMILACGLIVGFLGVLVYRRYYIKGEDV